ncbi:hypothetical protein LR48_Vigan11g114700 [Vigna angularis]|uniref:Putative plant transposon protein domain-containing protein n=1 Tax=Phaseolus angularis TaxID=3914 RepID=A0A0L9VT42_PHAAN|nr:hypothetical protein LR48_Vigan11g114700 [Vigna angularis]
MMTSSSDSKRIKTTTANTKRRKKGKEKIHSLKFLTRKHQKNFEVVQNQRLLMERKVTLLPLEVLDFEDELIGRHWNKLATYPAPASITVVKEFYAKPRIYLDDAKPFMSYVRGKHIPFDAETINTFLKTECKGGNAPCQFAQILEGDVDFREIERTVFVLGGRFQRNGKEQPLQIKRYFLTPLSKLWMSVIHVNLSLCSHLVQPPAHPYQMMEMRMTLLDAKLEVLHKSDLATIEMIRHLYFASLGLNYMSPKEFNARVALPRDQAYSTGEGGASTRGTTSNQAKEEEEAYDAEKEEDDSNGTRDNVS